MKLFSRGGGAELVRSAQQFFAGPLGFPGPLPGPPSTFMTKSRMILEPEQDNEDPSAVRSFTSEVEVEAGPGKTEMEAPKSTRNHRDKSLS